MEKVDLALVLAMDASGSISPGRLSLQVEGYATAIGSADFAAAARCGPRGNIALTFLQWSGHDRQDQVVGWTLIDGVEAAVRFASAIRRAPGPVPGYTSISGALDQAAGLLARCRFDAARRVIDLSGDGRNNDGRPLQSARSEAVSAGITINGLPILGQDKDIGAYYRAEVMGGSQSFCIDADAPDRFADALLRKLLREVAGLAPAAPTTVCEIGAAA